MQIPGAGVFSDVLWSRSLGDRENRRTPYEKAQRDLARSSAMRLGDLLQHATTGGAQARKAPMTERAIGDYGYAVLLAPRDHCVLNRALLQVIENLVARDS